MTEQRDLLGAPFWDSIWSASSRRRFHRWNYYHHTQYAFLRGLLEPKARFIELGCAGSIWIRRFAHDYETWGIDYSAVGLARLAIDRRVPTATLKLGDVFDANNGVPRDYFDVVFSDGLLEHFSDPVAAVRAFAAYARPGGLVVTSVPNMYGEIGRLHRLVDPDFFAAHVRYRPYELDRVHRGAGLVPAIAAHYWGHFSLGVLSYRRLLAPLPRFLARSVFVAIVAAQQLPAWALAAARVRDGVTLAPHLRGAYRRPDNRE